MTPRPLALAALLLAAAPALADCIGNWHYTIQKDRVAIESAASRVAATAATLVLTNALCRLPTENQKIRMRIQN